MTNWGSIESTFIADARFLMEHWPHPQWQPLWYTGTRFDYVYPPALRYGTALIAKVSGVLPVRAYRFYTGLFYCLGIAGVYLLIRVGSRSRGAAWMGAVAAALMSPSFLILKQLRMDSPYWMPQRLHVLEQYGEGPHMTALALIPFALAFTWIALEGRRWGALACAAIFSAAVVANNFYGATALAIFYPILVFSLWVTQGGWQVLARALAILVLAYGLCAFWLTPSYVRITGQNMMYVAQPGNAWSAGLAVLVAVVFAAAAWKLARGKPERAWVTFCAGCGIALTLLVAGGMLFDFRVAGEPARLVPELDVAYILLARHVRSVAVEAAWRVSSRRCCRSGGGGVRYFHRLPAARMGAAHRGSGLPESRGVPDSGLGLGEHAGRPRVCGGFGAFLVQRMA